MGLVNSFLRKKCTTGVGLTQYGNTKEEHFYDNV